MFYSPRETLLDIAKTAGVSEKQFDACMADKRQVAALNERVQNKAKKHEVDATPTFEINGRKMEPGYHSLAEIDAAIENAGK